MITNNHNADTQDVKRRERVRNADGTTSVKEFIVKKPKAICDYNDHMKGVDHFDQMIKYYHFTRKCHKWTKKIFFYFLQMAIHNSFVLYKQYSRDPKKMTMLDFHGMIVDALIDFNHDEWPSTGDPIEHTEDIPLPALEDVDDPGEGTSSGSVRVLQSPETPGPSARRSLEFLPSEHDSSDDEAESTPTGVRKRPRIVDDNKRLKKNILHSLYSVEKTKRKRCRVCYKSGRRRDTFYICKACQVPLCVEPCFHLYHSKKVYWDKQ